MQLEQRIKITLSRREVVEALKKANPDHWLIHSIPDAGSGTVTTPSMHATADVLYITWTRPAREA